jgi:hypothetical protein
MLLKKNLIDQFQKPIYGLFILWLGVLAPMVYFDPFAANHHVRPYHFALFEGHGRVHSALPAIVASSLKQQLNYKLTHQQEVISNRSPFPGLAYALQWGLGQLYLVTAVTGLLLLLFGPLRLAQYLSAVSVDLSPPEKPPRLA